MNSDMTLRNPVLEAEKRIILDREVFQHRYFHLEYLEGASLETVPDSTLLCH